MTKTQRAVLDHIQGGGHIASEHGLDRGPSGLGKLRYYHNVTAYDANGKSLPMTVRTLAALRRGGLVKAIPEHASPGYGRFEIQG
jgi:hypothetical protein